MNGADEDEWWLRASSSAAAPRPGGGDCPAADALDVDLAGLLASRGAVTREALARALAAAGTPVDATIDGQSLLHHAVAARNAGTVAALLQLGARADGCAGTPATPLMHAAAWGLTAVCRLLLEHGADPTAVGRAGTWPFGGETAFGVAGRGYAVPPRDRDETRAVLAHAANSARLYSRCVWWIRRHRTAFDMDAAWRLLPQHVWEDEFAAVASADAAVRERKRRYWEDRLFSRDQAR